MTSRVVNNTRDRGRLCTCSLPDSLCNRCGPRCKTSRQDLASRATTEDRPRPPPDSGTTRKNSHEVVSPPPVCRSQHCCLGICYLVPADLSGFNILGTRKVAVKYPGCELS
ncbi:hypothetical protein Bbelb_092480 [Branchiostoma belcheri]|nr:hypothetical protein Bbelb_092480 [Branchiostoma belcheri]